MAKKRTSRASSADATYELVIAPVSGNTMRTSVSSADIAALIAGDSVLLSTEDGQRYTAELVVDATDKAHHGRARALASAVTALPVYASEKSEPAGGLG